MAGDMSEFLDARVDDVIEPDNLPSGMYKFVITRYSLERATNDNKTPFIRATFKPVVVIESEAQVDLDNAKNVPHDFWHSEKAKRIEKRFLVKTLGLESPPGTTFGQLWERAIGSEVLGAVKSTVKEGKNGPWTETVIERFFRAD